MRRVQAGLRPLADLAAVADQDRVGMAVEQRLQRREHLHRMQAAGNVDVAVPQAGGR